MPFRAPRNPLVEEMLKRFLALAPALVVLVQGLWIGPRYDRFVLPAFDGFVYSAMAEHPRVFTLAPWGYRVLEPWIVHLLPVTSAAVGFFWLNLILLTGAVFLVGRWLRRLGFSSSAATVGGLTLALTPPVRAVLEYQVLVDPLAFFITALILNELVAPRVLTLAALLAVGVLSKEACLIPLLVVPFVLGVRGGWKRAAWQSLAIGAPSIGLLLLLRLTWGNQAAFNGAGLLPSLLVHFTRVPWEATVLFFGTTVLGFMGLVRERSIELRAIGCLLWFGNFGAAVANPYGFESPDLVRISLFAWTPWIPLVLRGIGCARAEIKAEPAGPGRGPAVASVTTLLVSLGLILGADSYRRAPVGDSPDPVAFMGRSRETMKTARALDQGEVFTFDWQSGRFATKVTERFNLTEGRRQRWFLYSGFGPDAAFGSGAPTFRGDAELLLPIFVPRSATMTLTLDGPENPHVVVSVAGLRLGSVPADRSPAELVVPQAALVRGDNIVRLQGPQGVEIRLLRLDVHLRK